MNPIQFLQCKVCSFYTTNGVADTESWKSLYNAFPFTLDTLKHHSDEAWSINFQGIFGMPDASSNVYSI